MSNLFTRRIFIAACGVALALALFQQAEAQRRGRGGLRPGNVTAAQLLMVDAVQKDIQLTDEQKSKVKAINEGVISGRKKLFAEISKESGDRAARVAELNKKAAADIEKLLDETQRKRLQEILLQANGATELNKKEIQEALKITKEQDAKLKEVRKENAKARQETLANLEGDRIAKMVELQKAADEKLLAVLTPEQRKQFEAMQGKKIELNLFSS